MKMISLSDIASEMALDPKTVRAILRRNGHQRPGTRWKWPVAEKSSVKSLIRAGQRKPKKEKTVASKRRRTSHEEHRTMM